jgi:hypothetical protein
MRSSERIKYPSIIYRLKGHWEQGLRAIDVATTNARLQF